MNDILLTTPAIKIKIVNVVEKAQQVSLLDAVSRIILKNNEKESSVFNRRYLIIMRKGENNFIPMSHCQLETL